jgi:threonine/homoserine/homoserine lactone efflux protein
MNCLKRIKLGSAAALVLTALRPETLLACAACYGQSDSAMAKGMNWGIFSLLAVVACVLATIAVFFVHVGRRSAVLSARETDAEAPADEA